MSRINNLLSMKCNEIPPEKWIELRFENYCYFYPMRDCPGWNGGDICSRIGKQIPSNAEME